MSNNAIMNKINSIASDAVFKVKKHSPAILLTVGIAGVVTSAVMACVATTKLESIAVEAKDTLEKIDKAAKGEVELKDGEEYTEEDKKKDITITYVQTGLKIAKLYAPSVAIGAASLICILSAHSIMSNRAAALTAAYTTIDKGFKEYRQRVIERYGENVDRELKYNAKIVEKEVEEVNEETGEVTTVKKNDFVYKPEDVGGYARFFEEYTYDDDGTTIKNVNWRPDNEYNILFLKSQERFANDLLRTRKRLFLNDVYRMLGLPASKAGQVVGWVYDPEKNNYIDFGLYKDNLSYSDYVNGYDPAILVDFNVDGNVWETMK